MGWGILAGLGQGLGAAAKEPQQYYQNTRQAMLEDSQLESQALNRALAQIQGMQDVERHPLEMQGLQSILENQAMQRKATQFGMGKDTASMFTDRGVPDEIALGILGEAGLGGLVGADGRIPLGAMDTRINEANIAQSKAQGQAALTSAGASVTNANANALESKARAGLYDAQTAAGGFRPGGSGSGSAAGSIFNVAADNLEKDPRMIAARDATRNALSPRRAAAAQAEVDRLYKELLPFHLGLMGAPQEDIQRIINSLAVGNVGGGNGAPVVPSGTKF